MLIFTWNTFVILGVECINPAWPLNDHIQSKVVRLTSHPLFTCSRRSLLAVVRHPLFIYFIASVTDTLMNPIRFAGLNVDLWLATPHQVTYTLFRSHTRRIWKSHSSLVFPSASDAVASEALDIQRSLSSPLLKSKANHLLVRVLPSTWHYHVHLL